MRLFLFLLNLFLPVVWSNVQSNNTKPLTINIEYPKDSGIIVEKDLVEFIQEAKLNFLNNSVPTSILRKKLVMVMGLTGTGKSTLVNYLNDIPLVCVRQSGKWILDLANPNQTLPGGFGIGHKPESQTIYPAVYSSSKNDFSFIDNPGFRDTRGLSIEMANGFFRKMVTNDAEEIKFILMLAYSELKERGLQFRDSIKGFSDFLGIFDDNDTKNLSKSIGIVVSLVENRGSSDEEILDEIKKRIYHILDGDKINAENKNEDLVFRKIIDDNQIEIFSNPRKKGPLENDQKIKILNMTNKLNYFKTKDAKLRVRLEQSYIPNLLIHAEYYYKLFERDFNRQLIEKLTKYFESLEVNQFKNNSILAYKIIAKIKDAGKEIQEFDSFLNSIDQAIMNKQEQSQLMTRTNFIKFLLEVLPQGTRNNLVFKRKWINIDIDSQLNNLLEKLNQVFIKEYNSFELDLKTTFDKSLTDYKLRLYNIIQQSTQVMKTISTYLFRVKKVHGYGTSDVLELDIFLKIWDLFFETNVTQQVQTRYILLKEYIENAFPKQDLYTFNRKWIDVNLNKQFDELFDKLIENNEYQLKILATDIEKLVIDQLAEYFFKSVYLAKDINEIQKLENFLSTYHDKFTELANITSFLDDPQTQKIIEVTDLKNRTLLHTSINNFLPAHKKIDVSYKKKWLGSQFISKYFSLKNEIKQYYQENDSTLKDGVFEYTGYFSNMSRVMNELEAKYRDSPIKQDLKAIHIFLTHTFDFDVSFLLSQDKYEKNHPNLIVIARNVLFSNKITVDLTCRTIPGYPDNLYKAKNGIELGSAGENGKPGLPGYNGGNLKIIYDRIYNDENLKFVSLGGQGGPGQNGGDGAHGQDGADALADDITEDCSLNEMLCTGVIYAEAPRYPKQRIEELGCRKYLLESCYLTRIVVWEDSGVVKKSSRYHARNGKPGQVGGNSGKPGKGGNPGRSGQSNIVSANNHFFKWSNSNQFVAVGLDGKTGSPAQGGKNGNGIERAFFILQLRGIALVFSFGAGDVHQLSTESEIIPSYVYAPSGLLMTELNEEGIQYSKESAVDFYGSEKLYMKFLNDSNEKFINSRINQQTFYINFKLKFLDRLE